MFYSNTRENCIANTKHLLWVIKKIKEKRKEIIEKGKSRGKNQWNGKEINQKSFFRMNSIFSMWICIKNKKGKTICLLKVHRKSD